MPIDNKDLLFSMQNEHCMVHAYADRCMSMQAGVNVFVSVDKCNIWVCSGCCPFIKTERV